MSTSKKSPSLEGLDIAGNLYRFRVGVRNDKRRPLFVDGGAVTTQERILICDIEDDFKTLDTIEFG